MASLLLLCIGHDKSYKSIETKKCKCKFIKVDPYIKQHLATADQELLEDYLSLVNSQCDNNSTRRLSILTEEQKKKFQDLILQIHLLEAGLI